MSVDTAFVGLAAAAFLGVSLLAAVRGKQDPLAPRLLALSLSLCAYNVFELAGNVTLARHWEWLNCASANIAAAAGFHFLIAFLGRTQRNRASVRVTYAYFGALATACLLPVLVPRFAWFPNGSLWALLTLGGMLPSVGFVIALLVRHARREGDEERLRTILALGSVALGAGGAATDLVSIAGTGVPRLAAWGLLGCGVLMAAVALRFRILEGVTPLVVAGAFGVAFAGVLAEIVVLRVFSGATAIAALGTTIVLLGVFAAARFLLRTYTAYRERLVYHANMGRMSLQMAHDLRNPIAAIRGAAQLLQGEVSPEDQARYLRLIIAQADRVESVVATYQRIGKMEVAIAEPIHLDDLVEKVVEAGRRAHPQLELSLERGGVGACEVDGELLEGALENLLKNASDAMPEGGRVRVRTGRDAGESDQGLVWFEVADEGPGMDVRTRERALEDFYTTKATGSGLGLSFVRRVAEAHRGRVVLESALGAGTRVRVELPAVR
jgi:signal transduction histidine kinase